MWTETNTNLALECSANVNAFLCILASNTCVEHIDFLCLCFVQSEIKREKSKESDVRMGNIIAAKGFFAVHVLITPGTVNLLATCIYLFTLNSKYCMRICKLVLPRVCYTITQLLQFCQNFMQLSLMRSAQVLDLGAWTK